MPPEEACMRGFLARQGLVGGGLELLVIPKSEYSIGLEYRVGVRARVRVSITTRVSGRIVARVRVGKYLINAFKYGCYSLWRHMG